MENFPGRSSARARAFPRPRAPDLQGLDPRPRAEPTARPPGSDLHLTVTGSTRPLQLLPPEAVEALLDRAGALVYVVDADGLLRHVNATARDRLDLDGETLDDWRTLARTLYPDARIREQVLDAHTRVLAGEAVREGEWVLQTMSGQARTVRWSLSGFGAGPDRRLIALGDDVTDRRRMESRVRLLHGALDHVPEGVWLVDPEGRIQHQAGGAEELLGYTPRHAIDRPWSNLLAGDDPRAQMIAWLDVLKSTSHRTWTAELVRADGATTLCQVDGARIQNERGSFVAAVFVARRHVPGAEPGAVAGEGWMRAIETLGTVAVVTADGDGKVLTWNGGAERLAGVGAGRAIGRKLLDEVLRAQGLDWAGFVARLRARGRFSSRVTLVRSSGTANAELEAVPLRDGGDGVLLLAVDRSDADAAAEDARWSKERAFAGVLTDALTRQLADTWAFLDPDQNAILARLHTYRALVRLVAEGGDADSVAAYARAMGLDGDGAWEDETSIRLREGLQQLRALVMDGIAVTQADVDAPTTVRLGAEMAIARRMVGHVLAGRTRLDVDLESLPPVRAGRAGVLRGLTLLLLAAAEAAGPGATVRVRGRKGSGRAEVEVREDGQGFAPDVLARLGDTAWLATQRGIGPLYLGLARDALRQAGGSAEFGAAPGLGSWVRVSFPTVESPSARGADEPAVRLDRVGRVLVVEEDPQLRRALVRALAQRHHVVAHPDLATALETEDALPDAAVLGLCGTEPAQDPAVWKLLRRWPGAKTGAIAVMPVGVRASARSAVSAMGFLTITRPVDVPMLLTLVGRMLGTH